MKLKNSDCMKKSYSFFLGLFILGATLSSCDKHGYQEFDNEEIYKHLSSVNVGDAKMIYTKEAVNTRAGSGEAFGGVWKIDRNGNEAKLTITGNDGKTNVINIYEIIKLSDKFLLMFPDSYDISTIRQEWENEHNDDPSTISSMHGADYQFAMLLNIETEKLFRFPENTYIPYSSDNIFNDKHGNIYYGWIYKLNPQTMTVENILPDGEDYGEFNVNADGFITYWDRYNQSYKIKCPGGRIVPLSGDVFFLNDKTYSIKDKSIYLWEQSGDNNVISKEVCKCDIVYNDNVVDLSTTQLINTVRKTILLRGNWGKMYEFNGEKISESIEVHEKFMSFGDKDSDCATSKAWYVRENTEFHKLDMQTYKYTNIPFIEYNAIEVLTNTGNPDVSFTGYQYLDGRNVLGKLTYDDKVVIEKIIDSSNKIVNLIPIN